jgi:hypothetical protein
LKWFLGDDAAQEYEVLDGDAAPEPTKTRFPDAGYYVLGVDFGTPREIKMVADAGPLGYLSIAAHGHADALSFTLSAAGRELLIDPGTFAYHTQKQWRDYFRGTSAHNTVRIDGEDQSVSAGNFLWTRHAHSRLIAFDEAEATEHWIAEHDGYKRLADPVTHRRELIFDRRRSTLVVIDDLKCKGSHDVEIFWHFAESCDVSIAGRVFVGRSGDVSIEGECPHDLHLSLHRGVESPPLGWISRSFDARSPTATVRAHGCIRGSMRLTTRFKIKLANAAPDEALASSDAMEIS